MALGRIRPEVGAGPEHGYQSGDGLSGMGLEYGLSLPQLMNEASPESHYLISSDINKQGHWHPGCQY